MHANATNLLLPGTLTPLLPAGYATTSATHLSVEKLEQVVAATSEQQAQARATLNWESRAAVVEYLLLERDVLGICALW